MIPSPFTHMTLHQIEDKYDVQNWRSFYNDLPYHNYHHIEDFDFRYCPSDEAALAAIFHDAGYDPNTSESQNIQTAVNTFLWQNIQCNADRVVELIKATTNHRLTYNPADRDVVWLHVNDLRHFTKNSTIDQIIKNERKILQEYNIIHFASYKAARECVLDSLAKHPLVCSSVIDDTKQYLNSWRPKIGVYCGSFNPFHAGHYDVYKRAEPHFDKVIIGSGVNPSKKSDLIQKNPNICGAEWYKFDTITQFVEDINYHNMFDITFIRGIRNAHDLHDEIQYQHYVRQLTGYDFMNIITSAEHMFTSSSVIKSLAMNGEIGKQIADKCLQY